MAQHDYTIANQTFPNTRADINNALSAVVSQNSGASAPSTTYAYQLWYDTTNDILKQRNADDDAWIDLFDVDQTADTATPSAGGGGGGKVLQVVNASVTAGETFTSLAGGTNTAPNYADTNLTLSITPSATTSKILVFGSFYYDASAGNLPATLRVERDIGGTSTAISAQLGRGNYNSSLENTVWPASITDLDDPQTTSAITYTVQIGNPNTGARTLYFNSNYYNAGMFESFLTAIEIGA